MKTHRYIYFFLTFFALTFFADPVFPVTYQGVKEYTVFQQHLEKVYLQGKSLNDYKIFERAEVLAKALMDQAFVVKNSNAVIETHFILIEGIKNAFAEMAKSYNAGLAHQVSQDLYRHFISVMARTRQGQKKPPPILEQMTKTRFGDLNRSMEAYTMVSQLHRAMKDFAKTPGQQYYRFSQRQGFQPVPLKKDPKTGIKLSAREWELFSFQQNMEIVKLAINKSSYGYAFTVKAARGDKTISYNIVWGWEGGKWLIIKIDSLPDKL